MKKCSFSANDIVLAIDQSRGGDARIGKVTASSEKSVRVALFAEEDVPEITEDLWHNCDHLFFPEDKKFPISFVTPLYRAISPEFLYCGREVRYFDKINGMDEPLYVSNLFDNLTGPPLTAELMSADGGGKFRCSTRLIYSRAQITHFFVGEDVRTAGGWSATIKSFDRRGMALITSFWHQPTNICRIGDLLKIPISHSHPGSLLDADSKIILPPSIDELHPRLPTFPDQTHVRKVSIQSL